MRKARVGDKVLIGKVDRSEERSIAREGINLEPAQVAIGLYGWIGDALIDGDRLRVIRMIDGMHRDARNYGHCDARTHERRERKAALSDAAEVATGLLTHALVPSVVGAA
jgi:hypothetical protein